MFDCKKDIQGLKENFVDWSKTINHDFEWETNYPEWATIYTSFEQLLNRTDFRAWDAKFTQDILYLIARDNECERLIEILHDYPECLLFLSQHGLNYPDPDARWQLAHHLSAIFNIFPESEEIINNYYQDVNEYVRRRALLALGYIRSHFAEKNALNSWENGEEYQKIAALHVLYEIDSPALKKLLLKGETDLSELIKDNVKQIKELLESKIERFYFKLK